MLVGCQPGAPLVPSHPHQQVSRPDQRLLCLSNVSELPPFLMTVVSDSDLWMYVSSAGGLTCGRQAAEHCLFPYETDDRLHRASGMVGPVTYLRVQDAQGGITQWRPFLEQQQPGTRRRLFKSELGHQVVFEEHHEGLGLTFRYRWANSRARGFVRSCELRLEEGRQDSLRVGIIDGLRDIMPAGVELTTQQRASALVNAYRHAELDPVTNRFAIYRLTAKVVDTAEPAEALNCNAVWSAGLQDAVVLLSNDQVWAVHNGAAAQNESEVAGRPASYLLSSTVELGPGDREAWDIVADVRLSQAEVVHRRSWPAEADIRQRLQQDIDSDGRALLRRLAAADGLQRTGVPANDAHHLANVLFNCMRGGVFMRDYLAPSADIRRFITSRSAPVAERNQTFLDGLATETDCTELVRQASAEGDADLLRLCLEYLPISFSRRHGDPSRPWNAFDIRVDADDGAPRLYYQGNWRDIFQNWEALALSFPGFLPQIIAKFVNASTADGFNPYRITSDGIDWEIPDKDDPWSNIGYWGDHQIVYLTRLLEHFEAFWPGAISDWLSEPVFTFADVPYRLRAYEDLVKDPRDSIEFDADRHKAILERVERLGADGRLLSDESGAVVHVSLAEKLLIPILAKVCNLVFDGGIWMNTQRPEWNDANNALAGNGLSMVTLYQLRRHLALCLRLFEGQGYTELRLTREVAQWLQAVQRILHEHCELLQHPTIDDTQRRALLDALGEAFADYRAQVYAGGLHPEVSRPLSDICALLTTALPFLDHAIRVNKRQDGLYEAYNLLHASTEAPTARVEPLYEMLEGQVAVLSSGVLSAQEAVSVLDALFNSPIYRADQHSFMLYPDRRLPSFLDKNIIPKADVSANPLLQNLVQGSLPQVALKDDDDNYRFAAHLSNAADLGRTLDTLSEDPLWTESIAEHRQQTLQTWETVFSHHAFTGRSGSMYGYEGLGCIYWHMESKLLLAVQENLSWAQQAGADDETLNALTAHYLRVRGGLGTGKSAKEYGAFPTDPYSHTSKHRGAQQPGMTGQVKEEILTRFAELGVSFEAGQVCFGRGLLSTNDLLSSATSAPKSRDISAAQPLDAGTLHFTIGQVPVTYHHTQASAAAKVVVTDQDDTQHAQASNRLDEEWSRSLFLRDGRISKIDVWVAPLAP